MQVHIFVHNAPNISDAYWWERIENMTMEFEAYKHCLGANGTVSVLKEWQRCVEEMCAFYYSSNRVVSCPKNRCYLICLKR